MHVLSLLTCLHVSDNLYEPIRRCHDVEETLKSVGAKIIRVTGGMSASDALTKYYVEVVK